jgi:hypothetical protein
MVTTSVVLVDVVSRMLWLVVFNLLGNQILMFEYFVLGCKVSSLFFALFSSIVLVSRYFEAYCRNSRDLAWEIGTANQVMPAFNWTCFIALTYYV